MDLVETDDHFVLKADLPGLTEDDVHIEVEDDVLTVSGERKAEHEDKHEGYVPRRALVRGVPPLADAARGRRPRGRQGELRPRRPRGPHPQARAAQAAPGRDPGRRRARRRSRATRPPRTQGDRPQPAGPRSARARGRSSAPRPLPQPRSAASISASTSASARRRRARSTNHSTTPASTTTTAPPSPARWMNFSALWPTKYASSADRRRPRDAAQRVPEQEGRPGHARDARHPRGGDAQPGDPAPEEDRLGPVTVEERLADRDDAGGDGAGTGRARSAPGGRACARWRSRRCRRGSRPRRRRR